MVAGLFAIPYVFMPHFMRHNQVLCDAIAYFFLLLTLLVLVISPAVTAKVARRAYAVWGLLPLAVATLWMLAEKLIVVVANSQAASLSLGKIIVHVAELVCIWVISAWPVAVYKYSRNIHHIDTAGHE